MREEDGARYLSPLVKQDLAKLDTDGDTRRLAMKSLKLFVEQLDASTLPRFISQIAESREPGATRSYAISLYEDCARVHGTLVAPHIPKVMATMVRSSSASGSFPQLQVACARVTASLAVNCINSTTPQEEAEEIMREISIPLVDALSGKLEPVAANAAACLHALVETEKWKYIREMVVHEVCERTTVALSEKPTRTAAHMQLIRILASVNPDVVSLHGANLLRAGEEILKVTANSWQLRKAAAQLLQSVLTVLDKETLETELNSALHALDSCRLDKMPHVRAAVSEALHTAKMLGSENEATHSSIGMAASPIRRRSTDRSGWIYEDHVPISPVSKGASPRTPIRSRVSSRTSAFSSRGVSLSPRAASPTSQESRRLSFSPTSTSASEYSVQAASPSRSKGGLRAKRAPVYPARGYVHSPRSSGTAGTSPSSSTTTVEECESPSRRLIVKEFDVQSRTGVHGRFYPEEDGAGRGDNYLRPLARLSSDAFTLVLPTQLDNIPGVEIQKMKDASKDVSTNVEVVLPRLKLGSINTMGQQSGPLEHVLSGNRTPILKASRMSLQARLTTDSESEASTSDSIQESSYGNESTNAEVEVEKHEIFTPGIESTQVSKLSSKHHFTPLAHLNVNFELDERTTQSVSLAKDFPHLVTPKRLVRSLSNLSIPESRGSSILEHDMTLSQDDPLFPGMMSTTPVPGEFNAETSNEGGWSIRDNPIASEEFYRAESLDEEFEARRGTYESTFSKPSLNVGSASPREIRMISPAAKIARSLDDGATLDPISRCDSDEGDEGDHPCPACVLTEQTFTSCRMRTPCQGVKSMQSPSGLSSLLHEEETKCESSSLFSTCACELCESKSGNAVEKKSSDCTSPSKKVERRSERGLRRMVSQNWKRICWFTECALGGSLCLVIALPLAMIVVKALNGPRDCHLVPT